MPAIRPESQRLWRRGVYFKGGERAIDEDNGTGCTHIAGGTECHGFSLILRGGGTVNPVAFGSVERHLLTVEREEILPKEFPEFFEQRTEATDDRKVAAYGILGLGNVPDEQEDDNQHTRADDKDKRISQNLQNREQIIVHYVFLPARLMGRMITRPAIQIIFVSTIHRPPPCPRRSDGRSRRRELRLSGAARNLPSPSRPALFPPSCGLS